METSSKRGKIPQKDWPSIIKRYEAGETLAAIARTYDCSPPAISYILSRSRARDAIADSAAPDLTEPSQPELVKIPSSDPFPSPAQAVTERGRTAPHGLEAQTASPIEGLNSGSSQPEPAEASNGREDALDRQTELAAAVPNVVPAGQDEMPQPPDAPRQEGAISSNHNGPFQRGEPRGTLHLALPQHSSHRSDVHFPERRGSNASESAAIRPPSTQSQTPVSAPAREQRDYHAEINSGGTIRTAAQADRATEGGAFIDRVLRQRVDEAITAFLAAFDAALAADSLESRAALRQATDHLLRAGARTRIELERLEARMPLPAREKVGHPGPSWRPR